MRKWQWVWVWVAASVLWFASAFVHAVRGDALRCDVALVGGWVLYVLARLEHIEARLEP